MTNFAVPAIKLDEDLRSIAAGRPEALEMFSEFVFLRDDGVFDAPLESIWRFLGSGDDHERAHGHRKVRRKVIGEDSGSYSWEQPFQGAPTRFTMRWVALVPVGVAYDVLEGPFQGSKFFLCYRPDRGRTAVSIVGAFTSPTIPSGRLASAVRRFFAREFEQDSEAIRRARKVAPAATAHSQNRTSTRRRAKP